jgi:hypothetical protein
VTVLGRLIRRQRGPKGTEFYDLAERSKVVPAAELDVAEAAMTGAGPIGERLVRQLREASEVFRLRASSGGYELRIATKLPLVRDVPRSGWRSDWIPVTESGRRIEMKVGVVYPGFAEIVGRTTDGGEWPKLWAIRNDELEAIRARAPWIRFPTPTELRHARAEASSRLSHWLRAPDLLVGRAGQLQADPPATIAEIEALATREAFPLPADYRSLLENVNGFELGRLVLLGTGDAYRLDMPGPDRLVISPPNEDGALTLAPTGEVVWVAYGDETTEGRIKAPDLLTWVRHRLESPASRDIRAR